MALARYLVLAVTSVLLISVSFATPEAKNFDEGNTLGSNSFLISVFNISSNKNRTRESYSYKSYQGSVTCTAAFPPAQPQTIAEIQDIIFFALQNKYHVKAVGNCHSISNCICTDGIVVETSQLTHFSFDSKTNIATAGAGMTLMNLMIKLNENGRSLTGIPSYGDITVGGSIGTGAHGTNLNEPATLTDQIVSVTVVDGEGKVRKIGKKNPDFKAYKLNLGLLGIVYEVEIRTVPQYKLKFVNSPMNEDILFKYDEIINLAKNNDKFSVFWFPLNKKVVLTVGNKFPLNESGNCQTHLISECHPPELCGLLASSLEVMQSMRDDVSYFLVESYMKAGLHMQIPGRTPYFTKADGRTECLPEAVGLSHLMMTNRCKFCAWHYGLLEENTAVSIALSELPAALKTIKEIMDELLTPFPLVGILIRFMHNSDAYMAVNANQLTVDIEWASVPRWDQNQPMLGITGYQAMGQALVERHGGRPHWAKNGIYYRSPHIVKRAFPNRPKFIEVMNRADPYEIFMNDFGQIIKYDNVILSGNEQRYKTCALYENCLCKKDLDCGNGGLLDYICDDFLEFKVCNKRPNPIEDLKDAVSRKTINLAADTSNSIDRVLQLLSSYGGFDLIRKQSLIKKLNQTVVQELVELPKLRVLDKVDSITGLRGLLGL